MTKAYRVHETRWTWVCLLLSACAGGTCPEGSVSMGDACVPLAGCPNGQERIDGECAAAGAGGTGSAGRSAAGSSANAGSGGSRSATAGTSSAMPAGAGGAAGSAPPVADPCSDLDCGAHGECVADGDDAACMCAEGYVGDVCDACVPGQGLSSSGECVGLCEAADAPNCGEFGHCVTDDETASCECDHPHGGELCEGCAEGYALNEATCVPDCGDCGPHSYCDPTPLVPACACVAGYRRDGPQCEWVGDGETGGIVNGDFASSETGWVLQHATIANKTATFGSNGQGTSCELGLISQTFKMPKRSDAEPLVLEIDALPTCTQSDPEACPPLLVEIGESVTRVRVPGAASPSQRKLALCLGESGFGEEVLLRIRPGLAIQLPNAAFRCGVDSWPSLEGVRIRTAQPSECPPPESGLWNGDFAASSGWTFESGASIMGGALNLHASALASTKVAFPLPFSVPSPALRFSKTTGDVYIRIDGLDWVVIADSGSSRTGAQTICMPEFALGAVHQLDFYGDAEITEMSIVTNASCDDNRFDSGFERPLGSGSWFQVNDAEILSTSEAHGGSHVARVEENATFRALARFPEPTSGTGNAAMRVWGRLETGYQLGTYSLTAFGAFHPAVPVSTTNWEIGVRCAGRAWNGQLAPLFLQVSPGASRVFLDDTGPGLSTDCN